MSNITVKNGVKSVRNTAHIAITGNMLRWFSASKPTTCVIDAAKSNARRNYVMLARLASQYRAGAEEKKITHSCIVFVPVYRSISPKMSALAALKSNCSDFMVRVATASSDLGTVIRGHQMTEFSRSRLSAKKIIFQRI